MTPRVRFAFLCRRDERPYSPGYRMSIPSAGERLLPCDMRNARRTGGAGAAHWPGFTWLLLISAIELAISAETSVMLPGTIIVLLVLASAW